MVLDNLYHSNLTDGNLFHSLGGETMLQPTKYIGTGVSVIPMTHLGLLEKYTGIEVDQYKAEEFIEFLHICKEIKLILSTRATETRWGTCFCGYKQAKIILYRHSVATFIHELAHVTAWPARSHDEVWGEEVARLLTLWDETYGETI